MKVCVIIRVFDRIEDLKYCVDIIRDSWLSFDYYIVVVSNGKSNGYVVGCETISKIDKFVELEENAGHLKGNAQLLHEGLCSIPAGSDFTVILEADTWMFSDRIIKKYVQELLAKEAVWASAKWYTHLYSLATDFAIIRTDFLRANSDIFTYTGFPECFAANYIMDNGYKFIYIKENMLVHIPSYLKRYPFAPVGRFYMFPKAKMVTHHIENLPLGIDEKKYCFNIVSGNRYFITPKSGSFWWQKIKLEIAVFFSNLLPQKTWFIKTKRAIVNK